MCRPSVNKDFKINNIDDLPLGTYGDALLLTETMEGWRTEKPIVNNETCKICNMCYLVCPEGAIYIKDNKVCIDYRFCKGCGICSNQCRNHCISMIKEDK